MGQRPQSSGRPRQRERDFESSAILPLPGEVQRVAQNGNRCENISLWLDRFLMVDQKTWELTQDAKRRARVTQLANASRLQGFVSALQRRYEAILRWHEQGGLIVKSFEAKPVWRFVVGLGATHVLETGITLHRLFGLPIIPGSGLKGAARAYALFELAKELGVPALSPAEAATKPWTPLDKLEAIITCPEEGRQEKLYFEFLQETTIPKEASIRKLTLQELRERWELFRKVFGIIGKAGSVVFLDAVPLETPQFQLDIMNPHYPNYYRTQGQGSPADWESPTPVFFLTVQETPYQFALAARHEQGNHLLDIAERWLKCALSELGIGAKTTAGYGYWKPYH